MNNCLRSTFYSLKSFADDMFSCLGQYLNGNILRNQVLFNQGTKKLILGLGSSRETNLNLFKTNLYKKFEKLNLLLQTHRNYKCLISVTKVYRAPDRGLIHIFLLRPFHTFHRRHVILTFVLGWCHHFRFPPFSLPLIFFCFCNFILYYDIKKSSDSANPARDERQLLSYAVPLLFHE